jgi:hypothetical protein
MEDKKMSLDRLDQFLSYELLGKLSESKDAKDICQNLYETRRITELDEFLISLIKDVKTTQSTETLLTLEDCLKEREDIRGDLMEIARRIASSSVDEEERSLLSSIKIFIQECIGWEFRKEFDFSIRLLFDSDEPLSCFPTGVEVYSYGSDLSRLPNNKYSPVLNSLRLEARYFTGYNIKLKYDPGLSLFTGLEIVPSRRVPRMVAPGFPNSMVYEDISIADKDAKLIARSDHFRNLITLDLSGNYVGDEGAKAFAGSSNLSDLKRLILAENAVGYSGALALVRSEKLRNLSYLDIRSRHISGEERKNILRTAKDVEVII